MIFPLAVIADLIFRWEVALLIKYHCATEKKNIILLFWKTFVIHNKLGDSTYVRDKRQEWCKLPPEPDSG